MYYIYPEKAIEYLKAKDPQLKKAIDTIGVIQREVNPDLYFSIVSSIIGQQISSVAHKTILARLNAKVHTIKPMTIFELSDQELQSIGISNRKVTYIKELTYMVINDPTYFDDLHTLDDQKIIDKLIKIKGVGKWTAEMLMIFSLQRPNILSYDDLAIIRGLRMLYHHRQITPKLFKKYQRRFSPFNTTASLYLWAISAGAIPELKDLKPRRNKQKTFTPI